MTAACWAAGRPAPRAVSRRRWPAPPARPPAVSAGRFTGR